MTSAPEPAEMDIVTPGRSGWRNLSFVWLVPILALIVSLGVAWKTYSERGGLIEITFTTAAGVTPGETTIRFREVVIGTVETVGFTDDLTQVVVHARIDQEILPFLDAEAQFWVVTPQVTTRGISGLSTVLSGVYIEAAWDATSTGALTRFTGLETPPLVQAGRAGKRITLRTTPGVGVSEGGPVLYRGLEVGRLEKPRLAEDDKTVVVDAFIEAPHDERLNSASRFWDTSGFSVSFGASGFALNVDSISSLIAGGVAFDNIYEGGNSVEAGYVYDIFYDEAEARASVFAPTLGTAITVSVAFTESISGLTAGAPVQLGGLNVGEVTAIAARIVETADGPEVRLIANLGLDPQKLGLGAEAGADEVFNFLDRQVAEGLRARLGTSGLFSSSLIVELVNLPDQPKLAFNRNEEPFPTVPAVTSDLPDFTSTVEGVLERINRLPVEDTLNQAIRTMASVETLLSNQDLLAMPGEATGLISDARSLMADEDIQALPGELRGAVADLRSVVSELREQGTIDALSASIKKLDDTLANVSTASEDFPKLMQDLRDLAAKANSLEAEQLLASATKVLNSVDGLIGTEEAKKLPPALTGALDEVRLMLSELRDGGVVENVNATMESARKAAGAVETATADLPSVIDRLDSVLARADGLVAAYGARSDFNSETLSMLREVRAAAKMVGQLARTIERNPNSLIMGR
ncbi:PqiB family protein [Pseudotabrizicola sp. L79]|uniref:PqiB family protein n=1 Tax=Pseudotabrizicola sp. L79 TaxID=3118402 RepID=UPI002F929F7F